MHIPAPQLPTLSTKPSWHNRAGRTDRSACAELTVRHARQLAPRAAITTRAIKTRAGIDDPAWTEVNHARGTQPSITHNHATSQTPARKAAIARAPIIITARELFTIHRARNPIVLQGDTRTAKSNVMKPASERNPHPSEMPASARNAHASDPLPGKRSAPSAISLPRKRSAHRKVAEETARVGATAHAIPISLPRKRSARGRAGEGAPRTASQSSLQFNPNAGACREKILGLPIDWQQTVTLLCPSCAQRERAARNSHDNPIPTANNYFLLCPICNKRVRKLFLPLCTEQEARDAHLADTWLRTYEQHIRPHMTELYTVRNQVITRYAPLLTPRTLACRTCLGVRYGETRASRPPSVTTHSRASRRL